MTDDSLNSATASARITPARWTQHIATLRGWKRAGVCCAAGVVSVLALEPFAMWPLLFLTYPIIVFVLDGIAETSALRSRLWQAAKTGWWFGFGYFTAGLYWIGASFLVEPEKHIWFMPFAVGGLCAGLALFYALACTGAAALWRPGAARIFALAGAFFGAEWLRGHVLTGFPWNAPGYALTSNLALAQTASLAGAYGLTYFAVLIFASPAAMSRSRRSWSLPVVAALLLGAAFVWGNWRLAGAAGDPVPEVRLRLVQASIQQAEKWKPGNKGWILRRYLDLSRSNELAEGSGITHVIWPESAPPFLFMLDGAIYDAASYEEIKKIVPNGGTLVLGALRAESGIRDGKRAIQRVYNSLFAINSNGEVTAVYDKVHLVPFGEYLPLSELFNSLDFKQLVQQAEGFHHGDVRQNVSTPRAPEFLPLICYEAVFPGEVLPDGVNRPGWLLNITDDSWFGETPGPFQHLQQARVRAIEEGLPVVRSANSGISAIIDGLGRISAQTPLKETARLDAALPAALPVTFYSGHRNGVIIVIAVLAAAGYLLFRKFN
jgi:apolipoprotein N-acyltransferase